MSSRHNKLAWSEATWRLVLLIDASVAVLSVYLKLNLYFFEFLYFYTNDTILAIGNNRYNPAANGVVFKDVSNFLSLKRR